MSHELRRERADTIQTLEAEAQTFSSKGLAHASADAFDRVARLLVQYAADSPSARLEQPYRERALRHMKRSSALRSGEQFEDGSQDQTAQGRPGETGACARFVPSFLDAPSVGWDQVGGLDQAKQTIKFALGISLASDPEEVQLPGWRNMLLYGPPGTGKTLLGEATAQAMEFGEQRRLAFFNVKLSSLISRHGNLTPELLSEIYRTAAEVAPALVFVDELEALGAGCSGHESEVEQRLLATLMTELQRVARTTRARGQVFTLGATNRPWELDPTLAAMFDVKLFAPLPDPTARRTIMSQHLIKRGLKLGCTIEELATMTRGLSGAEIELLCRQVLFDVLLEENPSVAQLVDMGLEEIKRYRLRVRPLLIDDFIRGRRRIRPRTSPVGTQRFHEWRSSEEGEPSEGARQRSRTRATSSVGARSVAERRGTRERTASGSQRVSVGASRGSEGK